MGGGASLSGSLPGLFCLSFRAAAKRTPTAINSEYEGIVRPLLRARTSSYVSILLSGSILLSCIGSYSLDRFVCSFWGCTWSASRSRALRGRHRVSKELVARKVQDCTLRWSQRRRQRSRDRGRRRAGNSRRPRGPSVVSRSVGACRPVRRHGNRRRRRSRKRACAPVSRAVSASRAGSSGLVRRPLLLRAPEPAPTCWWTRR